MQLTIDNLTSVGGFSGGPVKRTVKWLQNGEELEAEVYVRPLSYLTAVKDIEAVNSGADIIANRIAACICHKDGSPVFKVSDITGYNDEGTPVTVVNEAGKTVERGALNKELSDALIVLLSEVSGLGKKKPKKS